MPNDPLENRVGDSGLWHVVGCSELPGFLGICWQRPWKGVCKWLGGGQCGAAWERMRGHEVLLERCPGPSGEPLQGCVPGSGLCIAAPLAPLIFHSAFASPLPEVREEEFLGQGQMGLAVGGGGAHIDSALTLGAAWMVWGRESSGESLPG